MSETPELDKQTEIIRSGRAESVQEFIDWLGEQGFRVCELIPRGSTLIGPTYEWAPLSPSPEQLMADHFGIDRDKVEVERRLLLARLSA